MTSTQSAPTLRQFLLTCLGWLVINQSDKFLSGPMPFVVIHAISVVVASLSQNHSTAVESGYGYENVSNPYSSALRVLRLSQNR